MSSITRVCSNALRAGCCRVAAPAPVAASRRCFAVAAASASSSRFGTTATRVTMAVACRLGSVPVAVPRHFSSKAGGHHEIAANGSKLWTYEQMAELAKDPKGVVIVDSREPGELEQTGRIPSAINVPVSTAPESFHISEEDFEERYGFPRPGKDTELVFYCKAGVRSRAAAALAKDAGWTKVGEYPGSFMDWEKHGGEVERGGKGPGQR
ncbi:Rhodanese-like domain-containing protein [Colletotrichum navitas]|uniref:Rhodanese-like domain-containing protein n=1 Tax=Colletotrichum navitas TaxID=681940 RepID=A0AAD8V649_9PEZI|nr:Rhodanese-like domain-containing protein [Colletotrichum navitas]KAK1594424.1 Rhodanese-like domain-containing protein [Colletotrichum navitas]